MVSMSCLCCFCTMKIKFLLFSCLSFSQIIYASKAALNNPHITENAVAQIQQITQPESDRFLNILLNMVIKIKSSPSEYSFQNGINSFGTLNISQKICYYALLYIKQYNISIDSAIYIIQSRISSPYKLRKFEKDFIVAKAYLDSINADYLMNSELFNLNINNMTQKYVFKEEPRSNSNKTKTKSKDIYEIPESNSAENSETSLYKSSKLRLQNATPVEPQRSVDDNATKPQQGARKHFYGTLTPIQANTQGVLKKESVIHTNPEKTIGILETNTIPEHDAHPYKKAEKSNEKFIARERKEKTDTEESRDLLEDSNESRPDESSKEEYQGKQPKEVKKSDTEESRDLLEDSNESRPDDSSEQKHQGKQPKTKHEKEIKNSPDYTKALDPKSISINYDVKASAAAKKIALYGVYSTRENYFARKYVNQKGETYKLQELKPAENPWEAAGISEKSGDFDILVKTISEKLNEIKEKDKETEIINFDKTFQDAIIKFGTDSKTAVVNFANEKAVGGGTLIGMIGQEELNMACTAGLYDNLLAVAGIDDKDAKTQGIVEYKDKNHSPEVGLYSKECYLIKKITNGLFNVIDSPIKINVISSSADEDEQKLKQKIWIQIALAILGKNDILITGDFGSGKYKHEPKQILEMYKETLERPEFRNKISKFVYVSNEPILYSEFDLNEYKKK